MKKETSHKRINDILLSPLERPVLRWLVARLPRWVTPNILTGLGLFGAMIICAGYWLTNLDKNFLWLASFGFLLNWFGDSLDGTLARYRKIERPKFGYFIDHTVDVVNQLLVGLGLGLSPYVSFKIALFALIGYLMVSIHTYITIYVRGIFKLSYGKLGPTEVRVIAILANTLVYFFAIPTFKFLLITITVYDFLVLMSGTVLIVIFVVSTFKQALELSAID
ncbi:MAG: CDP-alcohol phosphatidyltransferase family protein [bacterium]